MQYDPTNSPVSEAQYNANRTRSNAAAKAAGPIPTEAGAAWNNWRDTAKEHLNKSAAYNAGVAEALEKLGMLGALPQVPAATKQVMQEATAAGNKIIPKDNGGMLASAAGAVGRGAKNMVNSAIQGTSGSSGSNPFRRNNPWQGNI